MVIGNSKTFCNSIAFESKGSFCSKWGVNKDRRCLCQQKWISWLIKIALSYIYFAAELIMNFLGTSIFIHYQVNGTEILWLNYQVEKNFRGLIFGGLYSVGILCYHPPSKTLKSIIAGSFIRPITNHMSSENLSVLSHCSLHLCSLHFAIWEGHARASI